ncbi:MAG: hypothetical protein H9901_02595 [Candidatus Paralactobacillus gallistercoris]|uniref:Uncharacterized protein n=1 Tax=Candidatus Paralactobacillus gallistercoris TaxID=2838724 RepID=A0A948X0J4_9LACO|nr:hypothetical protein [Candidatus Paralactobacillus gallistercoris]
MFEQLVVTQLLKYHLIKQPYGGYFREHQTYNFEDNSYVDPATEELRGTTVGNTVDNLTRYIAFPNIPLKNSLQAVMLGKQIFESNFKRRKKGQAKLQKLFDKLPSLGRKISKELIDIIVCFSYLSNMWRSGALEAAYKDFMNFDHLSETDYQHITILVERSVQLIEMLKKQYSKVYPNFRVEYDKNDIIWGDGDIITNEMIVDFKCWKYNPYIKDNITQQVIYYLLGKNGINNTDIDFNEIKYLSLFDIRRNRLQFINVNDYQKELKYVQERLDQIALEQNKIRQEFINSLK